MSRRRELQDLPREALREYSEDARVDRVWRRLETEIGARPKQSVVSGRMLWMPAVSALFFASGVFVGVRWVAEPLPPPQVMAEPRAAGEVTQSQPVSVADRSESPEETRKHPRRGVPKRRVPVTRPAPVASVVSPAEEAVAAEMVPQGPPEWQLLADNGEYAAALESVEQHGGFQSVLKEATAEQLMLLVDAARVTGQRDRAIVALRRVVSQHGTDPNAPLAAWTLGSELAKAGDPDGAAQAFATYRALSPQGDFVEDALAREFEMALEQGSLEHARKLAEQYAKDFPDGKHGKEIRAALAEELARVSEGVPSLDGKGDPLQGSWEDSELDNAAAEQSAPVGADAGVQP